MTAHINAKLTDIAPLVIMPGDPIRAKYIAEKYLTNIKMVNDTRLALAYTGYYNSKKITIFASGMGMPSIAIYATELFQQYNVKRIIRVGTCGSYYKEINIKDIILVEKAYTLSNFAYQYNGKTQHIEESSQSINQDIITVANSKHKDIKIGNINTSDLFYSKYQDKQVQENFCLGVEMECFALFFIAKRYQKDAGAILTVSDNLVTKEEMTSEERAKRLDDAIILALDAI